MDENEILTPVATVVKLINDNIALFEPLGLKSEHIYAYKVDNDEETTTDPILVISELPSKSNGYGNNNWIVEWQRLQLTFYYPKDYTGAEAGLEQKIRSFLLAHRYYCYGNAGHVFTPDSQNITNTLKFNYKKEI